jgi:lysozyme family protein
MSVWDAAFGFLLANEGFKVSNDKADQGGLSKYGISQKSYPNIDIRNLTLAQAKEIYFRDYWTAHRCDEFFFPRIGIKFFDICVNSGGQAAGFVVQRALNLFYPGAVVEDGVCGTATITAVNSAIDAKHELVFLLAICGVRFEEYASYIRADVTQARFANNWVGRAFRLPTPPAPATDS